MIKTKAEKTHKPHRTVEAAITFCNKNGCDAERIGNLPSDLQLPRYLQKLIERKKRASMDDLDLFDSWSHVMTEVQENPEETLKELLELKGFFPVYLQEYLKIKGNHFPLQVLQCVVLHFNKVLKSLTTAVEKAECKKEVVAWAKDMAATSAVQSIRKFLHPKKGSKIVPRFPGISFKATKGTFSVEKDAPLKSLVQCALWITQKSGVESDVDVETESDTESDADTDAEAEIACVNGKITFPVYANQKDRRFILIRKRKVFIS